MSIVTRTGDEGLTGLMYNRRVPKTSPRVEAYGAVDELNAALGMARSLARETIQETLVTIQRDLVRLMGELATLPEDIVRYQKEGYELLQASSLERLDQVARKLENAGLKFDGWATPGANQVSAALEMARVTCRRAERRVWGMIEAKELGNKSLAVYLNRLSDVLWLMAREAERADKA